MCHKVKIQFLNNVFGVNVIETIKSNMMFCIIIGTVKADGLIRNQLMQYM